MNAVKSCLAVLAVVALASCSADPTKSSAGQGTIVASPAALAMQLGTIDSSASVIVTNKDALGGTMTGSYKVTVPGGAGYTAVIDTTYLPLTTGGNLKGAVRILVHATAASDGSFQVSGTGGTITIPVRIAPAPTGTPLALTTGAPGVAVSDTITAPSGVIFTGAVSITNAKGDSASARQGYAPAGLSALSADKSKLYFVAAPEAHGHLKVGMANASTPTNTYTVVSSDTLAAATYDSANAAITFDSSSAAFTSKIVATAPAGFRFGTASAPSAPKDTITNKAPTVVGFSPDSTQMTIQLGPSAKGRLVVPSLITALAAATHFPVTSASTVTGGAAPANDAAAPTTFANAAPAGLAFDTLTLHAPYKFAAKGVTAKLGGTAVALLNVLNDSTMEFIPIPSTSGSMSLGGVYDNRASNYIFTLNTTGTITAGSAPIVATFTPAAPAANVIDTMKFSSANFKFRPNSQITSNGMPAIILGMSADSSTAYFLPTPGTNGTVTVSNLWYASAPSVNFNLPTSSTVTVGAASDQGGDDPAGVVPIINIPALGTYGLWDVGTFSVADNSPDGQYPGVNSQVYRLTLGVAASLVSTVQWSVGRDVDVMMLADSNTTDSQAFGGSSGATSGNPEVQKSGPLTAGTYMLDLIDWSPAYPDTPAVGALISIKIVAQ